MKQLTLVLYFTCLILLSVYGAHIYWLVYWERRGTKRKQHKPREDRTAWPMVTVQLPLYNEPAVAARLIDAVVAFDYPKNRIEIQVLDDSDDETPDIIHRCVDAHQRNGVDISHIRRSRRIGYKAGALAHGLTRARGELVAVFDADNVPQPSFIKDLIDEFDDPHVGMVQARWDHLNLNQTLLSHAQAMYLDGHFFIEQKGRNAAGVFLNFNGTAGIWRKTTIASSGGWLADTLTEDLDLSYRAQMRGWRLVYRPDVAVPSELPNDVRAFKLQQYRWARGTVQTARKTLPLLWRGSYPIKTKLAATLHLTTKFIALLMVAMTVLLVPALWYRWDSWMLKFAVVDLPLFVLATGSMSVFYHRVQKVAGRAEQRLWWRMPLLMSVGIGLTITNSGAVLDGLFRGEGTFQRTPKLGVVGEKIAQMGSSLPFQPSALLELLAGLYALCAIAVALVEGVWVAVPFLFTFMVGYLYLGWQGLIASWRSGSELAD